VAEFSSNLSQQERTRILQEFKEGKIQLLICSDMMARGLDIEHVANVISYDPPGFVKTYVHRVGRTARAGREGKSFTILSPKEVHHFRELMKKTSKKRAERYILPRSDLTSLIPRYQV
jgi:ATP-dependent RNA helicase DDX51/DBP6